MASPQRDPGRGFRPLLSRAAIVEAALQVVRTDGLTALSMRRVADELDSAPMSLYRHVRDRQDLLLGMLDVIAAGIALPPPAADPRAELSDLITAMHEGMRRDAWVVTVLVTDGLASPRILPFVERTFAALAAAGLRGADALSAYRLLFQFVYGEVLETHHRRPDSWASRMARAADPAAHPALAAVIAAGTDPAADDFDRNLRRVLDGLLGA